MTQRRAIRPPGPTGTWRDAIALVLLAALLLRALVPAGMMPDLGRLALGGFPVMLCTADGERAVLLDLEGNLVPGQDAGSGPHAPEGVVPPCPYALAPGMALLPMLLALVVLAVGWPRRLPLWAAAPPPLPRPWAGPTRSPRGPPRPAAIT